MFRPVQSPHEIRLSFSLSFDEGRVRREVIKQEQSGPGANGHVDGGESCSNLFWCNQLSPCGCRRVTFAVPDEVFGHRYVVQGEYRHSIAVLGRLKEIPIIASGENELRIHAYLNRRLLQYKLQGLSKVVLLDPTDPSVVENDGHPLTCTVVQYSRSYTDIGKINTWQRRFFKVERCERSSCSMRKN